MINLEQHALNAPFSHPRPPQSDVPRATPAARSRRSSGETSSRRAEILSLLGAPLARELEFRARGRGVRSVDLLRIAVSEYLQRPDHATRRSTRSK